MDDLTPDRLAALTERLEGSRDELRELLELSASGAKPVSLEEPIGRLSRMDAMQAQAMAQASQQRREQTLRRIEAALQRLEEDEYGVCLECVEPINPKRLEFDPTVELCIDCASKAEDG